MIKGFSEYWMVFKGYGSWTDKMMVGFQEYWLGVSMDLERF
ncbi:MAG: hypothetical protein ABIU63_12505 [Chitinophagaceae bacterium]